MLKLKEHGLLSQECFKPVSYSSFDVRRREYMGQIICSKMMPVSKTMPKALPFHYTYIYIYREREREALDVLSVLPRDVRSGSLRTSAYLFLGCSKCVCRRVWKTLDVLSECQPIYIYIYIFS